MQRPAAPPPASKLDITEDEMKRIRDSMKDPAFQKELINYMQEMSKPEARAELE